MADEPADLFGRTLGGEFVLREKIGEGGHATVYRCEQLSLERDVVVKVLRDPSMRSSRAQERFLREARLASGFTHPYVAHIYAFGAEHDGLLWLAMELVQGGSLASWLADRGPILVDQFVAFFECIAHAVHAVHMRGIIHRDLKPSNIIVIERDGLLLPKLIDFGIAKVSGELTPPRTEPTGPDAIETTPIGLRRPRVGSAPISPPDRDERDDSRLTPHGAQMGSSAYMSPEQWVDAHVVSLATDVYALGILIYESLTARKPFVGKTRDDYYWLHTRSDPPALGEGFSDGFERVVQRALAKAADKRQASALELASELRHALRTRPQEQIEAMAQLWVDRKRTASMALTPAELKRVPKVGLGNFATELVAESRRRIARRRWGWSAVVATAAALVVGGLWYRSSVKADRAEQEVRASQKVVEATITDSELEQGRSALLHHEPDAATHLAAAYRRDPAPSTAFMLSRAEQPRLAEQARFHSTSGRMWSAVPSPDGAQIVTTDDRNAQVWDAHTHQLRFLLPHGAEVYNAVYRADSKQVITVASDAVRIWNATNGALVRKLAYPRKAGAPADYFVAALSPDGRLVAAMDSQGSRVDVWDATTGAPLAELPIGGIEFPGLAFSADGAWLAATGGAEARVFDTRTWRRAFTIPQSRIRRMAFDPTGPRLLTGAATGDLSLWAIPSGTRIRHLRDVGAPMNAVAVSPDGTLLAGGTRDGAVQIWRADSGELQSQLPSRSSTLLAVEFDRTSQLVLATYGDGAVVVADVAQGMPVTSLEGPHNTVRAAHFDPSSQHVIAASWDGTARLWDASAPYRRWGSSPIADDCGITTTSEPDSRFLAVGCKDHPTRVWDTAHDQLLAELPSVSHVEGDFTSAFPVVSVAGDRAAIARGNAVEVYELPGGRLLHTIVHPAPVNAVAFASTGRDIISGAIDGSLLVARDGGALTTLPPATGGIDAVAFLPDGRVAAADAQQRLRFYDLRGVVVADLELPGRAMSLRSDGDRLVTVPSYLGDATPPVLVDLEHDRIITRLEGHIGRVLSARWASHQALTTGADGTARRWQGSSGRLVQTYRDSASGLFDATVTPDGWVVAGSADGLARFWDKASGRLLWALPAHKSQLTGIHVEGHDLVTRGVNGEIARWALPDPAHVISACSAHALCAIVPL